MKFYGFRIRRISFRQFSTANLLLALMIFFVSCGGSSDESKPAEEFTTVGKIFVGQPDKNLAVKGKQLFDSKCTACHKFDTRLVGPPLGDVVKKRTPEYIISMITSPDKMIQNNDTAKALMKQYMTPMTNQNVTLEDAKAIFEYLREISGSK